MSNRPRLVIYSPHWDHLFGITLWHWKNKKKVVPKYSYLIKNLVNNSYQDIDISFYVDKPSKFGWIPFLTRLRFIFWGYINGLNILKIKTLISPNELKENDIFFAFGRMALKNKPLTFLKDKNIIKLFHLTHFMTDTSLMAKNAKDLEVSYFISENNLYKNSNFFKEYFPYYKQNVYVLPFSYQDRFTNLKSFKERKNKVFVSGSLSEFDMLTTTSLKDFFSYFNVNTYHPMRKEIYNSKEILENEIDCYIMPINTNISATDNSFYKSFDMVEKLNEYKMLVAPEEVNNLPAIAFIEGMACGCAYIGKKDSMYEDIGFIDGINYIAYDGTINDLQLKIRYYQNNNDKLEQIAKNGYEFITKKFNAKAITDEFVQNLNNMHVAKSR